MKKSNYIFLIVNFSIDLGSFINNYDSLSSQIIFNIFTYLALLSNVIIYLFYMCPKSLKDILCNFFFMYYSRSIFSSLLHKYNFSYS